MAKFVQIQTEIHWHQRDGKSLPLFDLRDVSDPKNMVHVQKQLWPATPTQTYTTWSTWHHTSPHVFSHQSSPKQLQLRSTESPHHLGPSSHSPHIGHLIKTMHACRLFLAGCFWLGQKMSKENVSLLMSTVCGCVFGMFCRCTLQVAEFRDNFLQILDAVSPTPFTLKTWWKYHSWCKFRLLPGG